MAATSEATIELTPKQRRSAGRKRLAQSSLLTRLAWWAHEDRKSEGFQASALRAECKAIQKKLARLAVLTPSTTWAEDAARLPERGGGQFPPTDECGMPLMDRARGERCFYPRAYLTSSGHSFDVYVTAIKTGSSEILTEDGYNGSRVSIDRLSKVDQLRLRRAEIALEDAQNGERMITNIL